jgi:adenylylsulfate kinase
MNVQRALFIGRWQPLHNGHKWLIDQKLSKGAPVLIAVRDIPPDEKNPFTTEQTIEMLIAVYEDEDVIVISIPDI